MRRASVIICLTLLASCFSKQDAVLLLRDKERPYPIECVYVQTDYSISCTDGERWVWICDKGGACINTWRPSK